jgi:hypothetical protein
VNVNVAFPIEYDVPPLTLLAKLLRNVELGKLELVVPSVT